MTSVRHIFKTRKVRSQNWPSGNPAICVRENPSSRTHCWLKSVFVFFDNISRCLLQNVIVWNSFFNRKNIQICSYQMCLESFPDDVLLEMYNYFNIGKLRLNKRMKERIETFSFKKIHLKVSVFLKSGWMRLSDFKVKYNFSGSEKRVLSQCEQNLAHREKIREWGHVERQSIGRRATSMIGHLFLSVGRDWSARHCFNLRIINYYRIKHFRFKYRRGATKASESGNHKGEFLVVQIL